MALHGNFNSDGECVWCGEGLGDVQFPKTLKGTFTKRYKLVDGKVVDQYAGKTDEEAEALWLESVAPTPAPAEAA
jgi:hypothetical protein